MKIVFVNNFDYTNKDIVPENQQATYAEAVSSFTKGLLVKLTPADSIEMVIGDTLLRETGAGMLTTLLPIETIKDYCKRYNALILISIDSVNIGFSTNADYIESISFINFYSRDFYLYSEFFLSVYDTAGNIINRSSVDRQIRYSSRLAITSETAFIPSLANAARKIDRVGEPCGEDFTVKFQTVSENMTKKVYTGKALNRSVEMMKAGRWDTAVKTLENICATSWGAAARHAKANLEVAKEGAGIAVNNEDE